MIYINTKESQVHSTHYEKGNMGCHLVSTQQGSVANHSSLMKVPYLYDAHFCKAYVWHDRSGLGTWNSLKEFPAESFIWDLESRHGPTASLEEQLG